ncbi:hypothetical protein [Bradyrhizobium sp. LMG 9283]|uniref:hypothetical protein n=1 Tax=Bradyrhizobium sp. LMG 9283 TaxID=592064 RepID=UPI003890DC1C
MQSPHLFMQNLLSSIRLFAGLVAICLLVAYNLHTEQIFKWSSISDSADIDVTKAITDKLATLGKSGRVDEGAFLEVLRLRGSARNLMSIFVAQGDFTESRTIEGIEHWKDLVAGGALLVNSTDEWRTNDGGMSKSVAAGCTIRSKDPSKDFPDQVGSVSIEPCVGSYQSEHHVERVAHAAIVTWGTEGDLGRPSCKRTDKDQSPGRYSTDQGYLKCATEAIKEAVTDLFYRRKEVRTLPTLLLPALGTGTGAVQPNAVYDVYQNVIYEFLSKPELSPQLPEKLVLLLSRNWTEAQWKYHRYGIAHMVSGLHDRWSIFSGKYRQTGPIETLLGVLIGLIVLVLGIAARTPPISPRLFGLDEGKLTLTLIGWGLGAFGLIAALQAVLTPLLGLNFSSKFGTEINIGLGIAAVLLATFVLQGEDLFKNLIKDGGGKS